jgi:1-deoxy-D-xylulose-5-phosphate synthase
MGPESLDVLGRLGRAEDADRVLLVAVGSMAGTALQVADSLSAQGLSVTVVDPRWVLPLPPSLVELASTHRHVVVLEDNLVDGGVGTALRAALADLPPLGDATAAGPTVQVFGIPRRFIDHGQRAQVLAEIGLTAEAIAPAVLARLGLGVQAGPDAATVGVPGAVAPLRPVRPKAG